MILDIQDFNSLVIDSNSTDGTFEIIQNRLQNVHIFKKEFIDFYDQWKFALDKAIELGYTNGILIDADYRLSEEAILLLNNEITTNIYAEFSYVNIFGKVNNSLYPKRLLGGKFSNIKISGAGHTQNFEFINQSTKNIYLKIDHYDLKESCFDFIKQKNYSNRQVNYDLEYFKNKNFRFIKLKNIIRLMGIGALAIPILFVLKNKFKLNKAEFCYLSNRFLYEIMYLIFLIKKIFLK